MAPPFGLPPRPSFIPEFQPPATGANTAHFSQNATHAATQFTNTSGYQPSHFTNATGYRVGYNTAGPSSQSEQRSYQPTQNASPALMNPYAPHINYNLLPLPPVTVQGYGRVQVTRGFGLPPQSNGMGTFGPVACTHAGCHFRGQKKDVTFHMMDRHLIFPPGWKDHKRKRRDDGEDIADEEREFLSKGLAVIPGTTIALDTPEAIEAWKAERKKRWPSAQRIEEKEKARQTAIDRGEILVDVSLRGSRQGNKRGGFEGRNRGRGRGGHVRGRGRSGTTGQLHNHTGKVLSLDNGWTARAKQRRASAAAPRVSSSSSSSGSRSSTDSSSSDTTDEDDESSSDVDPLRDAISSKVSPGPRTPINCGRADGAALLEDIVMAEPSETAFNKNPQQVPNLENIQDSFGTSPAQEVRTQQQRTRRDPGPRQPRALPRNPFAENRPSLLRNLLLPDIRFTVSNLSQVIRFLVANDFLENVELKPGEAANPMIQVLDGSTSPGSDKRLLSQ